MDVRAIHVASADSAAAPSSSPWVGALFFLVVGVGFVWYLVLNVRSTLRKARANPQAPTRLTTSQRLRVFASATPAATMAVFFGVGVVMILTGSKLIAWVLIWGLFGSILIGILLWLAAIVVARAEHTEGNRQRAALGQVRRRALVQPHTAALWMAAGTFVLWLATEVLTAYLLYLGNPVFNSGRYNRAFLIVSAANLLVAVALISWAYRHQGRRRAAEERRVREADLLLLASDPPAQHNADDPEPSS